uniref:Uncharacterized protein n=1 Tax=Rhizophora mucronata TaxID=61149 RepID=A0A2P2P1N8_RHIMU
MLEALLLMFFLPLESLGNMKSFRILWIWFYISMGYRAY